MLGKRKSTNRLLIERIRDINHFRLLNEALGDFYAFKNTGKPIPSPYTGGNERIFGTADSATLTDSKVAGGREAARSVKVYRVVERTPGAGGTTYLRQVHPYDVTINGKEIKAGSYIKGVKPVKISTGTLSNVVRLKQSGIPGSDKWKPTKSPSYKSVYSGISRAKTPETVAKNVQRLKDMGVDPAKADKFGQNRIAKITKATGGAGGKKPPQVSSSSGGSGASSQTRTRADVKSSNFKPGNKSRHSFSELDKKGYKRVNKAFKSANVTLPTNHPHAPGGKIVGLASDGSRRYIVSFPDGSNDAFSAKKLGQDAVDKMDDVFQKSSDKMRKLRQFRSNRDERIKQRRTAGTRTGPTNVNQKLIAIQKEALKNAKSAKELKSIQKTLKGLGAYDVEARKAVKSRVKELRFQKGGGGITSSGKRVEFKAKQFRAMSLSEKITYMRRSLSKARTRMDFKVLKFHAKRSKIYVKLKTAFNKAIKSAKAAGSFISRIRGVPSQARIDRMLSRAGSMEKVEKITKKLISRAKNADDLARIKTAGSNIKGKGVYALDLGAEYVDDFKKAEDAIKAKAPATSPKAPKKPGGKNPLNPKGRQVFKPGGKVDQGIKSLFAAMQTKAAQYPKTAAALSKVGTAGKIVFKVMPAAFGVLELWSLYADWDNKTTETKITDSIMAGTNIALLVAEFPVALAFMGGQMAGNTIYSSLLGPIDDVFYQIEKMAKAKMGKLGFFTTGGSTLDTQGAFRLGDGVIGRSDAEGAIFKKAAESSGYKGMKPKELHPGYIEKIMITMQGGKQAKETGFFAKVRKSDTNPIAKLERLFDYKVLNRYFFEKKFKEWQKKTEQESLQSIGASLAPQIDDGFKPTKTPKGEIEIKITKEDVEKAMQDPELLAKIEKDPKFEEFKKQILISIEAKEGEQKTALEENHNLRLRKLLLKI